MNDSIEALKARKRELEERLAAIRRDLGRGLDRDAEEQAIELENFEVLKEISRVAERELEDVERRIAALKSGG